MATSSAPTSYTPTLAAPGSTPQFGQQDATGSTAIKDLQTSLNKTNAGKAGYTPLAIDGKYGPLTQAAASGSSNLINTSGASRTSFMNNSNDLANAEKNLGLAAPTNPTDPATGSGATPAVADPIISGLDSLKTANDNASNSLIASTQASYQNQINAADKQFESYKGGLQLLGIQHNEAQSSPDLLMGHIQQAALDHLDKINSLKAEEAKTIMDAKTAQANNDFKSLEDATTRLKDIQTEKATALKAMNDTITNSSKLAQAQIDPASAKQMYDTLQTLDDSDKQAFIEAVASKFGLSPLAVVQSLGSIVSASDKADLASKNAKATLTNKLTTKAKKAAATPGTYKFTNTGIGKLAATGLLPNEITSIQADIAAHGVQAVIDNPNSGLTDAQKALITKITTAAKDTTTTPTINFGAVKPGQ